MQIRRSCAAAVLVSGIAATPHHADAQGAAADYHRAMGLRDKYQRLAVDVADQVQWHGKANRFWYRKSVAGGHEFILVDADTQARRPAFDHRRLAAALTSAMGRTVAALDLPFDTFTFIDDDHTIEFAASGGPGPAGPPPRIPGRGAASWTRIRAGAPTRAAADAAVVEAAA